MSCGKNASKTRTSDRKLPGMGTALAIRETLVVEFPRLMQQVPETAKIIAYKVGTTPRAIEGQRQGEHLPRLDVGLALGAKYKPIRDLYVRLMDAESGESGENPAVVLNEISRLIATLGPKVSS